MINFKHNKNASIAGTHRVGTLKASYNELVAAFGKPTWSEMSADGKTFTEWTLEYEDGTVATIYDYKFEYDPSEYPEQHDEFSIGGRDALAADHTNLVFNAAQGVA